MRRGVRGANDKKVVDIIRYAGEYDKQMTRRTIARGISIITDRGLNTTGFAFHCIEKAAHFMRVPRFYLLAPHVDAPVGKELAVRGI